MQRRNRAAMDIPVGVHPGFGCVKRLSGFSLPTGRDVSAPGYFQQDVVVFIYSSGPCFKRQLTLAWFDFLWSKTL